MRKILLAAALAAVTSTAAAATTDPFPSTYHPVASAPVLIRNATVLTGDGQRLDGADVLLQDGKVAAVGPGLAAPEGAQVVDATGKWVTPGLIDIHSHLGVYASPGVDAQSDGNEATSPTTPEVWAEHSIWPQDPGFAKALAGGITTLEILPGSANLIGGRSAVVKNVAAVSYQDMKFPGAPWGMKMACGENPKRVYGSRGRAPSTRMGNVAGYREAFIGAQAYKRAWDKYNKSVADAANFHGKDKDKPQVGDPPQRDLGKDTLMGVLNGDIHVQMHCYRADEMETMLDVAKEFGFHIYAFHHAVEAYKIADRLADAGVCAAMWADWWGFKMESFDGIRENIALVDRPKNGCAIVHSDSAEGIQRLNQEAAKAMAYGAHAGIDIPPERAIRWLTLNPAKALGIDGQTGTLQPGKMGDVVVWNGTPFSVYAHAEKVYIDGALLFDRHDPSRQPKSDFMLGQEEAP